MTYPEAEKLVNSLDAESVAALQKACDKRMHEYRTQMAMQLTDEEKEMLRTHRNVYGAVRSVRNRLGLDIITAKKLVDAAR